MAKLKGSHSLSVWHQHSPPMHLLQRSGHSLAMHYPAIRDWHGKARKNRWRTPSRWEIWALAQLVGRGKRTFAPSSTPNHQPRDWSQKLLTRGAKTVGKNHHGALAQLVGRGKRTFAPNQPPKPPWGISTVGRTR